MIYLLKFGASFLLPPGVFFVGYLFVATGQKVSYPKSSGGSFFGNNPVLPFVHFLCIQYAYEQAGEYL